MTVTTDLVEREEGVIQNKRLDAGLAEGNGVIDPARWQMLAAIAETVAGTMFVPRGLREAGAKATLACLLYGDALGLQPMTSLKEVHVIDGMPGLSAAAMAGLVRKAHPGHRMRREELRDEGQRFLGVTAHGERGDSGETDSYTFTLEMAARAGLAGKDNWKKYPEAMCTARAYSQLCTFLFPDVFMGSPYMPEEIESFAQPENQVEPPGGDRGVIVNPPAPAEAGAAAPEADTGQTEWQVVDVDTQEVVATIDAEDRHTIAGSDAPKVRFPGVDGAFEIVGYEVDGDTSVEKLLVRAEQGKTKAAAGTPEAVIGETIPKVMELVIAAKERGDRPFIEGVLAAEKAAKNRGRLTSTLEEILAGMQNEGGEETNDDEHVDEGAADGADGFQPLDEAEPEAEAEAEAEAETDTDASLVELDPEIPFGSATARAKVARIRALCAVMEDQHPEQRAWRLEGVIASAAKQWGGTIESLDDLDEHQLELVWKAAEQYAAAGVQFLALAKPADIARMAATKEQS